jgi:hypothetical protein
VNARTGLGRTKAATCRNRMEQRDRRIATRADRIILAKAVPVGVVVFIVGQRDVSLARPRPDESESRCRSPESGVVGVRAAPATPARRRPPASSSRTAHRPGHHRPSRPQLHRPCALGKRCLKTQDQRQSLTHQGTLAHVTEQRRSRNDSCCCWLSSVTTMLGYRRSALCTVSSSGGVSIGIAVARSSAMSRTIAVALVGTSASRAA